MPDFGDGVDPKSILQSIILGEDFYGRGTVTITDDTQAGGGRAVFAPVRRGRSDGQESHIVISQTKSERVDRSVFLDVLGDSLDANEARETLADALTELDDVKLFVNISGNTIKARIESGEF